jgi:molybdate transport system substrate-binding protein
MEATMKSCLAGCLVTIGLVIGPVQVQAAEVRVLATGAQTGAFKELIPQFERASGHKVVAEYAATPQVMKKIQEGAAFDLVVMIDTPMKDPANQQYFAAGPRPPVGSVGLGAAVRAGAPKPDISTPEAFKQTLIKAKSVAILPESINGKHFLAVFDRLGIGEEMQAKIKPQNAPPEVPQAVAKGEAELALFVSNLLVGVPGLDYAGPVPAQFDQNLVFAAAVGAKAKEPEAASAFIQHLTTPAAGAVMQANGMQAP